MRSFALLAASASLAATVFAGSSAGYSITPEAIGALAGASSSAAYANLGSSGGIAGRESAGAVVAKLGFVGQLTEPVGLVVQAPQTFVNEAASLQLGASILNDDATTNVLAPGAVTWSVSSGPITGIQSGGLATAGIVFADTPATVQAMAGGYSGSLNLSVRNAHNDNFGSYAGDGIDDAWQVQYFGFDNPLAAPTADPNGTGQNNLFKFRAGLDPTLPASDPNARFTVFAQSVPGQPAQRQVSFQPVVAGRNYSVEFNPNLAAPGGGSWVPLTGFTTLPDSGSTRALIDVNVTDPKRFYRVQITKTPTAPGPTVAGR